MSFGCRIATQGHPVLTDLDWYYYRACTTGVVTSTGWALMKSDLRHVVEMTHGQAKVLQMRTKKARADQDFANMTFA